MAVTDSTKIDLLFKKLSGVARTDTGANKSPSNESIPSPALNRGDTLWLNSYFIPYTASATLGTVTGHQSTDRVKCTPDTTTQKISGIYPTWKTGLTDWIPPEFDPTNLINTYRVKVYYGADNLSDPSITGGTAIYADGVLGQGEWFFDYQSGILNFIGGTIPVGMTSSHVIYVYGYRYVGPKGFQSVFLVNNNVAPQAITILGDTIISENLRVTKDLEIQGGDLTTNQTTFNLLNTTATTVNFAGEATLVEIGSSTGKTNINNNLEVDGDVTIDGGDLLVTTPTFNLIPDVATTVNFATAATDLVVGATSGTTRVRNDLDVDGDLNVDGSFHIGQDLDVDGDLNIDGGDLTVSTETFNIANTVATTINIGGQATNIEIGSDQGTTNINNNLDVDGDVNIDGGDLTVSTEVFNLANQNANIINFGGDATIIEIGSSEGTTNVNNNLDVDGDVNIDGGDLTVSTQVFNLANENATTINFAGAATNIEIGSNEGNTNVNNNLSVDLDLTVGQNLNVDADMHIGQNLDVDGDVNIDGGDLTVSTEVFNLANENAKTVNFAGQATNIEIGSSEGDTSVNNNLRVDGIVDVNNHLYVEGAARVNQSLEVEDSVKVQRELAVEGDVNLTRDLNVGGYIKGGQLIDTTIDCGEY